MSTSSNNSNTIDLSLPTVARGQSHETTVTTATMNSGGSGDNGRDIGDDDDESSAAAAVAAAAAATAQAATVKLRGILSDLHRLFMIAQSSSSSTSFVATRQEKSIASALRHVEQSYPPSAILDALVPCLFVAPAAATTTTAKSSSDGISGWSLSGDDALTILSNLVQVHPAMYLKPAALAIQDEILRRTQMMMMMTVSTQSPSDDDHNTAAESMYISPQLLQVIISQLAETPDAQISTHATTALVAACQHNRDLGHAAMVELQRVAAASWKQVQQDRSLHSTVVVRCVTAMIELWLRVLGDDIHDDDDNRNRNANSTTVLGGLDFILLMLHDDETDPLLQMTALDLLESMARARPMHATRAHWLFRPAILQPILQLAGGAGPDSGSRDDHNDGDDDDDDSKMDIEQVDDDFADTIQPDPLLGGPALRVVAALCTVGHREAAASTWGLHEANQTIRRGFHRALHQQPDSNGNAELDRLARVDAISSFAMASPQALQMVLQDPVTRNAWLSLSVAQPKLKAVILHSVAMVLQPPPQVDLHGDSISAPAALTPSSVVALSGDDRATMAQTTAIPSSNNSHGSSNSSSNMKLFAALGQCNNDDPTHLLLIHARSPMPEVRLAAYTLLTAVARIPRSGSGGGGGGGAFVLLAHYDNGTRNNNRIQSSTEAESAEAGMDFVWFLLDRDYETTKEGREHKYELVQTILDSDVRGLLANEIILKLERYIAQGPHYIQPHSWELATE